MLSRHALLPICVLALSSCATAQGADKTASGPKAGLSDQDLEQRRANLDAKLATRSRKVKQSLDKIAGFQLQAEKERLDFERYIAEERKAFYTFLKSVRADEREAELDRFTDKQEKARLEFDKKQASAQKDWFHDTIEKPWKSESLELESGAAPMVPAPETEKAPAAEPKKDNFPQPARKYVYKSKKSQKPAVKKKASHPPEVQAEPQAPPAAPEASGGVDAAPPPPPPPGN